MAGQYHNKRNIYKTILFDWIKSSIENKSWEKYDDLHLDEIDFEFKQKIILD